MKQNTWFIIQAAVILFILAFLIGYNSVNSDFCKYIRVFDILANKDDALSYINSINTPILLLVGQIISSTDYKVLAFGLLSSILYLTSIYILIKEEDIFPAKNSSVFLIISSLLIFNPLTSNISGLMRSHWAGFVIIIAFMAKNTYVKLATGAFALSLQPMTILPICISYLALINSRVFTRIKGFPKFFQLWGLLLLGIVPAYIAVKIISGNFSYPELMLYLFIYVAMLLSYKEIINPSSLNHLSIEHICNISSIPVTSLALIFGSLRLYPDSYRILFPVAVVATGFLIIKLSRSIKPTLKYHRSQFIAVLLFAIFITPLYYMNHLKVFAKTNDILCDQLHDSIIQINTNEQ